MSVVPCWTAQCLIRVQIRRVQEMTVCRREEEVEVVDRRGSDRIRLDRLKRIISVCPSKSQLVVCCKRVARRREGIRHERVVG